MDGSENDWRRTECPIDVLFFPCFVRWHAFHTKWRGCTDACLNMIAVGHLLHAETASVGSHCLLAHWSQSPDPFRSWMESSHHLESQAPGCRDLCSLHRWLQTITRYGVWQPITVNSFTSMVRLSYPNAVTYGHQIEDNEG